jgi:hypothetical protein
MQRTAAHDSFCKLASELTGRSATQTLASIVSIVQPPDERGNSNMTQPQKGPARKPATKFPNLRKKMEQSKVRTKLQAGRVRKSGNR